MKKQGLKLKQGEGWFAAGREVGQALDLLSDGAFKLFIYLCLNAQRRSGRIRLECGLLARALHKSRRSISTYLEELEERKVCRIRRAPNQHQAGWIEISEAFWPYHKQPPSAGLDEETHYVERVRSLFLACPCVVSSFTPADQKLALDFYRRGVSFEQLEQAMLLGCARRYLAGLNGQTTASITSLKYFESLVEEISRQEVSDQYWEYVRSRLDTLQKEFRQKKTHASRPGPKRSHLGGAKFAQANDQTQEKRNNAE